MLEKTRTNRLGSSLSGNEKLYTAHSHLEKKLNITGTYIQQQNGKKDEVYFTSSRATSFGYACNFALERLFLEILRQEYDNNIIVEVGESKKDYYRKVIYQKLGKETVTEMSDTPFTGETENEMEVEEKLLQQTKENQELGG